MISARWSRKGQRVGYCEYQLTDCEYGSTVAAERGKAIVFRLLLFFSCEI